jgi:AcrR family transcriptional regulator
MTTLTVPADLFSDHRVGGIYRKAAAMISERGFDGTSMNQIAEALGFTKPALYYHVKGKKELLFSIMSFAMDRLDEAVVAPARAIADAEERLRLIIARHARLLTREESAAEAVSILMDETRGLNDELRARITRRKRAYFELLRGTLEELAAAGRLRPVDTTVGAFSLLGMVMWIVRWYQPTGPRTADDVVRDVTEIALGGMLLEAS